MSHSECLMRRLKLVPGTAAAALCALAAPGTTARPSQDLLAETSSVREGLSDHQAALLTLGEAEYLDKLRAMWLAQCLANWTGRVTEGVRTSPPFFTDADWGTVQGDPQQNGGLIDFVIQTPWGADDDTDIEYIYLHAMTTLGHAQLSAAELRAEWLEHIAPYSFIWGSNLVAHNLMRANPATLPGSTSFLAANYASLNISSQLTTEFFGALAPGDPVRALELAEIPIRTTASNYATHAAQFHVALYSLAAVVDPELPPDEQLLWLVRTARRLLPEGSKASDVIDFVLDLYLSIPNHDDWELARDAIHDRYQANDTANGFLYLKWYESPINLAAGLMALLFGEGDYRRTVQIGTLSGWDSDNGTATMGGLLGLLYGTQWVEAAFPGVPLSDHYDILATRINFQPPFCEPWHPNCLDTFTAMAQRMLPRVIEEVTAGGGQHTPGVLTLAPVAYASLSWDDNPLAARHASSGNNLLRSLRYPASPSLAGASLFSSGVSGGLSEVCDGLEFDFSGVDRQIPYSAGRHWVALQLDPGAPYVELTVTWRAWLPAVGVRFVEGPRGFSQGGSSYASGFVTLGVQVQVDGIWTPVAVPPQPPPTSFIFESIEWPLPQTMPITGVRLRGVPIAGGLATISELEAVLP